MTALRNSPSRKAPVWLQWIGQTLSFITLCVASLAAIVLIIVPIITDSQTYSVLTHSMAPHYPPGTFLVVKPTDYETLQVGDVVTYQIESGQPDVITHRIIGFSSGQEGERLLVTQGDNNALVDPHPVQEIQVRGKLFYAVPYVGFIANALGNSDRGSIVTVLAIALIAWGVFTMVRGVIRERREKRDQKLIDTATNQLDSGAAQHDEGDRPASGDLALSAPQAEGHHRRPEEDR